MILRNLLPWFKKNSHDGYRAVNRKRTKIALSTKRRGWFLNILLVVSVIAIIPIWIHLTFDTVEFKKDNLAELKNDNIDDLKNYNFDDLKYDNMIRPKNYEAVDSNLEDDDDEKLFDHKTDRLISSKAIRLNALKNFNLATIRNRHFAALKMDNLDELDSFVAPPTAIQFTDVESTKINKLVNYKTANLSAWKTKMIAKSKAEHVPETNAKLKYILQWTSNNSEPLSFLKSGQKSFLENKCPFTNCYVTNDRQYLNDDITKFDAVIFNGRNLETRPHSDLPQVRSPHQKYIFMNLESSDNQPICNPVFDGFFNWTATYKLNSDILYSFFIIKNKAGEVVGPSINMNWIDKMSDVNETILETIKKKTKAAAWFVSHCTTRCNREEYAVKLKNELKDYNLTLDIYGRCGDLTCKPMGANSPCQAKLRDEYFFYLAFENSCVEDYVSEKVLHALRNTVVPIVYGGSNYTRFLPPGSFIDARLYEPRDLASIMAGIISSPEVYSELFKWKNHYSYKSHVLDNSCGLCTALNDEAKVEAHTVYEDFRGWWNPDYEERCKEETWGT